MEIIKNKPSLGVLGTVAALVIVIAGMRAAQAILVPFFLALFISIICMPPFFWLIRRKVPKAIALMILILAVAAVFIGLVALIGGSLKDFSQAIPSHRRAITQTMTETLTELQEFGIHVPEEFLLNYFDPGAAMQLVGNILSQLGAAFANAFLILLTVIFMLFEVSSIPAKVRAAVKDPDKSLANINRFIKSANQYIAIKTWTSLATGLAISIWLSILGVNYALLWGLLAFLLNYVPSLGSILAAIPVVLLAFIQLGLSQALFVTAGYLVVNVSIGNLLEPRLMGRGLGLSTLVVFLSLVFWGWVLGPIGMLLSVPLTMMLKIGLESSNETKWIAILLGPEIEVGRIEGKKNS
jgi:AI-2 transport protein TqsA